MKKKEESKQYQSFTLHEFGLRTELQVSLHLFVTAVEDCKVVAEEGHSQDEDLSKLRFLQDEAPKHHTHKLQKQSSIMRGNYMPTLSTFMKAPRQAGEPSSSVTSTIALSFDEIVLRQKGFAILQKPNAATTGMCWSTKTAILHGRQGLENVGLWWQHHLSHKTHSSKAGLHLLCFVLARA